MINAMMIWRDGLPNTGAVGGAKCSEHAACHRVLHVQAARNLFAPVQQQRDMQMHIDCFVL